MLQFYDVNDCYGIAKMFVCGWTFTLGYLLPGNTCRVADWIHSFINQLQSKRSVSVSIMFVTLRILCKTLVKSVAKRWHVTHIFSYLFYLHSRQVNMQVVTRTVLMHNNA